MSFKSLIINPGSTSTKIGVFEDETLLFEETLRHPTEEIAKYASIIDQKDFRKEIIMDLLKEKNFDIHSPGLHRGPRRPVKAHSGGTYKVSDELLHDLTIGYQGQLASNLGGILAREIGDSIGVPSFIVDPVVVDELEPVARYSGCPELPRRSIFHALNQKAVARRYAKESGIPYEQLRLIVVHMGGGCFRGRAQRRTHRGCQQHPGRRGRILSGTRRNGSCRRSGKMCFSGKYTEKEIYKKLVGNGGFNAYVGTNDARVVLKGAAEGKKEYQDVLDAFLYQMAKDIGAMSAVLEGKVDKIILTGGIAYSDVICNDLKRRVGWIADFVLYPGEDELLALVQGGLRVMNGEEAAKEY